MKEQEKIKCLTESEILKMLLSNLKTQENETKQIKDI